MQLLGCMPLNIDTLNEQSEKRCIVKKEIFVLITIFISSNCLSSEVTISNTSGSPTDSVNMPMQTLNTSGGSPITFTASKSSSSPLETDNDAIKCLDTSIEVLNDGGFHQVVNLGDTLPADIGGEMEAEGTVKSTCDSEVKTNLWFYDIEKNGKELGYYHPVDIAAGSTCSVNVNTTPSFTNVKPGSENNTISVTTGGTGKGTLTFSPDKFDTTSGLLRNNESNLSYSITDATWNSTKGIWTGDLNEHDILLGAIPQNTVAGTYTGVMTVSIVCE